MSPTTPDPAIADPRETRLPVWAQDTINILRRRVADAEADAAKVRQGTRPETSRVLVDAPFFGGDAPLFPDLGLGDSTVAFRLGDPPWDRRDAKVRVSVREGRLVVMGDQRIRIMPSATNTIEIEMGD